MHVKGWLNKLKAVYSTLNAEQPGADITCSYVEATPKRLVGIVKAAASVALVSKVQTESWKTGNYHIHLPRSCNRETPLIIT
jgi:hypothetical protein